MRDSGSIINRRKNTKNKDRIRMIRGQANKRAEGRLKYARVAK